MKSTVISPTGEKIAGETVQNDSPSVWAEQRQMMTNKVFPMGLISLSTAWFFLSFACFGFGWFWVGFFLVSP